MKGGKSLLPAGITEVTGRFGVGDPVACVGPDGSEVARGLVAYAAEDIARIAGQSGKQIAKLLGYTKGDAVIHRDDLVVGDRE